MHLHQKLNQLPGRNLGTTARALVEFADQGAEPPHLFLKFFFAIHAAPFLVLTQRASQALKAFAGRTWGNDASPIPCRSPSTCAPRRASRDRSFSPPA